METCTLEATSRPLGDMESMISEVLVSTRLQPVISDSIQEDNTNKCRPMSHVEHPLHSKMNEYSHDACSIDDFVMLAIASHEYCTDIVTLDRKLKSCVRNIINMQPKNNKDCLLELSVMSLLAFYSAGHMMCIDVVAPSSFQYCVQYNVSPFGLTHNLSLPFSKHYIRVKN